MLKSWYVGCYCLRENLDRWNRGGVLSGLTQRASVHLFHIERVYASAASGRELMGRARNDGWTRTSSRIGAVWRAVDR